jgi:glycosyltransferase involved in cell wall biosynthesis
MAFSHLEPLVSVVIPAYNAELTLPETLHSVRSQTYPHLEIIVVDDGSIDATAALVRLQQRRDSRIRLIQQVNGGVAAARNAGAAAANGAFIAPIDSDDLWHPSKIEAQLRAFSENGPDVAVVYTWFALIDAQSRIIHKKHQPEYAGWVLSDLAHYNFVGNGSSPLIRTDAFRSTPGYDRSLKERGGQGCEDWKLYCQLSERYQYGLVRAHLTGYRTLPDNMSSNVLQMLRSRDLATADLLPGHPELEVAFRLGRNRLSRFMLHRAIRGSSAREIIQLMGSMAAFDARFLLQTLLALPREISDLLYSKRSAAWKGAEHFEAYPKHFCPWSAGPEQTSKLGRVA